LRILSRRADEPAAVALSSHYKQQHVDAGQQYGFSN
jgi:hypothetical protein